MSNGTSVPKVFVFNYFFRDGANFKTHIELLLKNDGEMALEEAEALLCEAFGVNDLSNAEFIPESISMVDNGCVAMPASEAGLRNGFLHEVSSLTISHFREYECDLTRFANAVKKAREGYWHSMEVVVNMISGIVNDYKQLLIKNGVAREKDGKLVLELPLEE